MRTFIFRQGAILGALSCTGLDAVMSVEGATDTAVFRTYVDPGRIQLQIAHFAIADAHAAFPNVVEVHR